jgi:hypothetical protein
MFAATSLYLGSGELRVTGPPTKIPSATSSKRALPPEPSYNNTITSSTTYTTTAKGRLLCPVFGALISAERTYDRRTLPILAARAAP